MKLNRDNELLPLRLTTCCRSLIARNCSCQYRHDTEWKMSVLLWGPIAYVCWPYREHEAEFISSAGVHWLNSVSPQWVTETENAQREERQAGQASQLSQSPNWCFLRKQRRKMRASPIPAFHSTHPHLSSSSVTPRSCDSAYFPCNSNTILIISASVNRMFPFVDSYLFYKDIVLVLQIENQTVVRLTMIPFQAHSISPLSPISHLPL